MACFSEHKLTIRCSDMETRHSLVRNLQDLFNLKQSRESSHIFSARIDGTEYVVSLNTDDRPSALIVFVTEAEPDIKVEEGRPTIVVKLGKEDAFTEGTLAVFSVEELDKSNLRSIIAYATMMLDCAPFGLQLRQFMSPLAKECLKRLFRSLDLDFDGRISLKALSDFNFEVFGSYLSSCDLLAIFCLLNEGEPLYVDTIRTYMIEYDQFEAVMQQLVNRGYGHTVFKLLEAADFRRYMFPQFKIEFPGETKRELGEDGLKFLTGLFNEFQEPPTHEEVMNLFKLQGGPPIRMSNTKVFTMREWIRLWTEWCIIEPNEAARNLVAFGFPMSKINDTFGVQEEKQSLPASTVAAVGVLTSIVGGVLMYMRKRK